MEFKIPQSLRSEDSALHAKLVTLLFNLPYSVKTETGRTRNAAEAELPQMLQEHKSNALALKSLIAVALIST